VSNPLHHLMQGLAKEMKAQQLSVFEPHTIITQTQGMHNWLNLQLATELVIAANINYYTPNQLVQRAYSMLVGRFSESSAAGNIRWLLFSLLGKEEFIEQFPDVAFYYQHHENALSIEQKKFSLANVLADLFDQYQIYRPEMISAWNSGQHEE